MISDPVGDMLTRIRNSYQARHGEVKLPLSKFKNELAKVLVDAGFLKGVSVEKGNPDQLVLDLKYREGKKPAITNIERVSKPSRHLYLRASEIKPVLSGLGAVVISTSKGLMTGKEARRKKLGGEIICRVW